MQERTIMDTKKKIIGAGGRTIPSLKKHIMRREIRYIDPEKNDQNLCFYPAYSFITMPDINVEVVADSSAIAAKRYKEHSHIRNPNFINVWIKQLFKETRKIIDTNKYEDETIPQHYEVPVIGFNPSKFDVALILKNLQSDEWYIIKYLSSGSNAKQIIVKHNILP
ncbi:MAG: hypothetical protein EZS28_007838 [Streblomastix strix]|uniref:Uncharacterized protein n=1 Tax=Streblomastix strix TaxID=222440 RepID=A0A5J4WNG8_9EUKA|nr:MAG: hypothetical protein EZS28_007838 [Streblomastix strix]